jgi:hypothetical protein
MTDRASFRRIQPTRAARLCRLALVSFVALTAGVTVAAAQDTTPPTITAVATPAANANGWNKTNVTVKFICADTGSGIRTCPAKTIVSAEGPTR